MKAYRLSLADDDYAGSAIVFANTAKEAKKLVFAHDSLADSMEGEWIRLRVNRSPHFDGMEKLSEAELAKEEWRDGWRWEDMDAPNVEEATDEEFFKWYAENFG